MRLHIDRDRCTSIGLCEALCPDLFELDDDGSVILIRGEDVPDDVDTEQVDAAVSGCPNGALSTTA
jgi:ferredoxin